jgi:hypothetical protein
VCCARISRNNEKRYNSRHHGTNGEENRERSNQVLLSLGHMFQKEGAVGRHGTLRRRQLLLLSAIGSENERTPTELPSRKRMTQSAGRELANDAKRPNTAVKKSVALNAALLPIRSEPI